MPSDGFTAAIHRYEDVEVSRIGSRVRLRQTGDGVTDEIYITRGELEGVVEEMQEVLPSAE